MNSCQRVLSRKKNAIFDIFPGSYLMSSSLTGSYLVSINFRYSDLMSSSLMVSYLVRSRLIGSYFVPIDFMNSNLMSSSLKGSYLMYHNLQELQPHGLLPRDKQAHWLLLRAIDFMDSNIMSRSLEGSYLMSSTSISCQADSWAPALCPLT